MQLKSVHLDCKINLMPYFLDSFCEGTLDGLVSPPLIEILAQEDFSDVILSNFFIYFLH